MGREERIWRVRGSRHVESRSGVGERIRNWNRWVIILPKSLNTLLTICTSLLIPQMRPLPPPIYLQPFSSIALKQKSGRRWSISRCRRIFRKVCRSPCQIKSIWQLPNLLETCNIFRKSLGMESNNSNPTPNRTLPTKPNKDHAISTQ